MATETKQIILRTGAGTPTTLAEAELGFATDTKTLFIGTGSGGVKTLEEKGHTHTKSNITDFPSSMPSSDVYTWAKEPLKPSYDYYEILNLPPLGTVAPINLPYDASQYLRGDGTWANTPTGLEVY